MKIWFDTEFIDTGTEIILLSIGMVKEDGFTYYAEPQEADRSKARPWVKEHVLPHLKGPVKTRLQIRDDLEQFCGWSPEFWAYFGSYDWVCLCQLFGKMFDIPTYTRRWPMMPMDLQQFAGKMELPDQTSIKHHALNDAIWTRDAYYDIVRRKEWKPST